MLNIEYNNLIKERKENYKQKDIAKKLNISEDTYSHYETKNTMFPIKQFNNTCNILNISLDYAFGFTKIKQYKNTNTSINNSISGKRLKEFRKENKFSQNDLANIFGIDGSAISKYERGIITLPIQYLYNICSNYNISADYLLGKINDPIKYK